ncbi:hypothetical protein LB559_09345 [Mesorhizobium sp. BR1-1-3]|uniref:hypothetical protein n=1 Tax=Mesorhizobium sp. BR1-1-3 TaxID=2876651 RepID=UPI001CD060DA|nr:hypothetical protein [Mesorhizobium sp. BR1-1-3]MBZ9888143.1 hypothetical protein [Mesorhizobium sp. BR1-1-3]
MTKRADNADDWLWTYADVLLLSFFGMCVLAFVALASINPPTKATTENVPPPGDIMICMTWQGHNDLDLWATAPGQDIATGYSHKGGKVLDLVRDDLGMDDNEPVRQECQFGRGLPDGRYIVNVHGYAVLDKAARVRVEVRMGDGLQLVVPPFNLDIRSKQERTVVQFRLAGGRVVSGSLNSVYVPLRSAGK